MLLDVWLELVESNGDGAPAIALVLLPLRSCSQRTSRDCRPRAAYWQSPWKIYYLESENAGSP